MNHSIKPGVILPPPGLEKEEPELADEDDIPSDNEPANGRNEETGDKPLGDVERE